MQQIGSLHDRGLPLGDGSSPRAVIPLPKCRLGKSCPTAHDLRAWIDPEPTGRQTYKASAEAGHHQKHNPPKGSSFPAGMMCSLVARPGFFQALNRDSALAAQVRARQSVNSCIRPDEDMCLLGLSSARRDRSSAQITRHRQDVFREEACILCMTCRWRVSFLAFLGPADMCSTVERQSV